MKLAEKFVGFVLVQVIVIGALAAAVASLSPRQTERIAETVTSRPKFTPVQIKRNEPLEVKPLYNDPEVVSDEELAAVLLRVQPKFSRENLKPNYVEHALRTWRVSAKFQEPGVMSGEEMRDFLLNYAQHMLSWGDRAEPLLQARETGIYVRWGRDTGISVHHDHTLACVTEAGVPLDYRVQALGRPDANVKNMVEQALFDFRLDERETEWSAMAFGLWLPPVTHWTNGAGRELNFDLIAKRQLRGHRQFGVCGGTHRVYSLMLLLRINEKYPILSEPVRAEVYAHLEGVRDTLKVAQFPDGHWPYNWPDGKEAVTNPGNHAAYRDVIATGHHLEWLAIAPEDLHPPREMIRKAARWIIDNTTSKSRAKIQESYTFYSHVGNALALWRGTSPPEFWHEWEKKHPYQGKGAKKPEPADDAIDFRAIDEAAEVNPTEIEVSPESEAAAEAEGKKPAATATPEAEDKQPADDSQK
jgi:hypothetical protein